MCSLFNTLTYFFQYILVLKYMVFLSTFYVVQPPDYLAATAPGRIKKGLKMFTFNCLYGKKLIEQEP